MPTYATPDDLTAYIAGLEGDRLNQAVALIPRAERQVDDLLGPYRPRDDTGLKLDPVWLERIAPWARRRLADAVCAQVEYLLTIPSGELVAPERLASLVSGPDFQVSYGSGSTRSLNAPRMLTELEPVRRLLGRRGARARA